MQRPPNINLVMLISIIMGANDIKIKTNKQFSYRILIYHLRYQIKKKKYLEFCVCFFLLTKVTMLMSGY